MRSSAILVVEDDRGDSSVTQGALAHSGIANRIVLAEDGEEALDYLFGTGVHNGRDLSDEPILVLLDLKLSKLSGLDVLGRIRGDIRTERLPVVILTSSNEDHDLAASHDLGANGYIGKPVDFERLREAIEQSGLYWLLMNEAPPIAKGEATGE